MQPDIVVPLLRRSPALRLFPRDVVLAAPPREGLQIDTRGNRALGLFGTERGFTAPLDEPQDRRAGPALATKKLLSLTFIDYFLKLALARVKEAQAPPFSPL